MHYFDSVLISNEGKRQEVLPIRANLPSKICRHCQESRHVGGDCRHPHHIDILVMLAIPGIRFREIPYILILSYNITPARG